MRATRRLALRLLTALGVGCGDSAPAEPPGEGSSGRTATGPTGSRTGGGPDGSTAGDGNSTAAGTTGPPESGEESEAEAETAAPELPPCPTFAEGVASGSIESVDIAEASGLAASRSQADVQWTHNDSGDSARLFAIDGAGALLGQFTLQGAAADDWEDIAIGPGPDAGVDYLYVADVGDNAEVRRSVTIYRVPEPDVADGSANLTGVDALCVQYPDAPHDAETLLVDPDSGDLVIVTKTLTGTSFIFGVPATARPGGCETAEAWGELTFGVPPLMGSPATTAGDISNDGSLIVVRTYTHAYGWRRVPGLSIESALQGEACPLPLAASSQGEALALMPGGESYVTVAEGATPTLWRHDLAR